MDLGETHLDSPGVQKALDHLVDRYAAQLTLPVARAVVDREVVALRDSTIQAFLPVLVERSLREASRNKAD